MTEMLAAWLWPFFLHSGSNEKKKKSNKNKFYENIFAFRWNEHNHFKSVENSFTIFNDVRLIVSVIKNKTLIPSFPKSLTNRILLSVWVCQTHIITTNAMINFVLKNEEDTSVL